MLVLLLSHDFYISCLAFFIMGICAAGRASVGFFLLVELIPKERVRAVSAGAMMCDCLTLVTTSLYFMYVSHNSFYWEAYALFSSIMATILVAFFVPESPLYLWSSN